ncbi:helix-turn-helix domain-containing protein [Falsirhodobacter halotolerans]|uniref:helix-turn-helix domain-containing protein n=1 Tax=Falsirhodobacter halotolerans TaxID=1146892 RepID=UPI001FD5709D|nr:helix-turn-helix domain-containing protein [Falsirhodobacter halotolerans]MCJ8139177.1 helix-turn-helix domain-containing protein [Falsirhodobacter halotolerans]
MTSAPTDRIIDVLEYVMNAPAGPVKQVDIARDLGLAPATLNRIVRILSDRGYLFRTSEKYLIKNFTLDRIVPMSAAYLAELQTTLTSLTDRLGAAAEVIVVAGHELLWHSRTPHPDRAITIWAREGFRRSLFEFDALSCLYLSTLAPERLGEGFFIGGFFDTSTRGATRQISWLESEDVERAVTAARGRTFVSDAAGNHFGIRRFATIIRDAEGRFLHLLSIADAATSVTAETEHRIEAALEEERARLERILQHEHRTARLAGSGHLRLVR